MSKGLEFFKIECGTFSTPFIKTLTRKYPAGLAVYYRLLDDAYRTEGYFLILDDDLIDDICVSFDLSSDLFTEILEFLKARGKLIELNHEKFGRIITSESLQIGFTAAAKERARRRKSKTYPVDDQIWILSPTDTMNEDGENYIAHYSADVPDIVSEAPRHVPEVPRNVSEAPRSSKQSRVEESRERVEKRRVEERESRADTLQTNSGSNGMYSLNDSISSVFSIENMKANFVNEYGFSKEDVDKEIKSGQFQRLIEKYSPQLVLEAGLEAYNHGKQSFGYVTAILKKWKANGYQD